MNPTHIPNANRRLGPPRDWDEERNGPCEVLELLDTGEFFQSAWVPDSQEVACIQAGAPIVVTVWGRSHPPIAVAVMPKPGYVTVEAFQAAFSALRNLTFMCRTATGLALGTNADPQLLGSIELAESVVGQIPADANRRAGDPKMLEVPIPQAAPSPHVALLQEARDYLKNLEDGMALDGPGTYLIKRLEQAIQP